MPSMARWCFRHRKLVLALWLVALILFLGADIAAKTAYSSKFQIPNTESTRALNTLKANFPSASGEADQIVMEAKDGSFATRPSRNRQKPCCPRSRRFPASRR